MELPSFVIPAATGGSPDSVAKRRRMAELMLASGMQQEPIRHWSQGANKIAQALIGGIGINRADKMDAEGRSAANAALVKALQGGDQTALIEAINNPYQTQAGTAMLASQWEKANTPYKPDYKTFNDPVTGDIMRYDANDPNSKPGMFYDAPDKPVDPMAALALERAQLEIEKLRNPDAPKPAVDDPLKFTDRFNKASGMSRVQEIAPTVQSMYKSLSDPSAMADLDFIYGLAKILDPTSVVRESEAGMVIDAQGIAPSMLGQLNKFMSGEQALLPEIRQNLFKVAFRRAEELQKQAQGERQFYSKGMAENQMNPETYLAPVPNLPQFGGQNMQLPPGGMPQSQPVVGQSASAPDAAPRPAPQPIPQFSEEQIGAAMRRWNLKTREEAIKTLMGNGVGAANPEGKGDASGGWTTLPNGVRIRRKQ